LKLLIVDDNPDIRELLKNICVDYFTKIFECEDGLDAVKIYEEEKPDWVLMDIKMKYLDGITATKQIIEKYPGAKIIILSQYNDKNIVKTSLNSGALKFIPKEDMMKVEEIIKSA